MCFEDITIARNVDFKPAFIGIAGAGSQVTILRRNPNRVGFSILGNYGATLVWSVVPDFVFDAGGILAGFPIAPEAGINGVTLSIHTVGSLIYTGWVLNNPNFAALNITVLEYTLKETPPTLRRKDG